ncbi:isochorismate synthase [Gemmatimonas aurantiaca]|uniref:isochorismate synthase n=1 Tax=Gemmatimonas aurantiaca TaxID=173480 RepID=UPI00301C8BE6
MTQPPFLLSSGSGTFMASGVVDRARFTRGDGLASAVSSYFAGGNDPDRVLVGAIPFDRHRGLELIQPALVTRDSDWSTAWAQHMDRPAPDATDEGQHDVQHDVQHDAPHEAQQEAFVPGLWHMVPQPTRASYEAAVARATAHMEDAGEPGLRKVVLSRSLVLNSTTPIDLERLLARLRLDASVTTFATPLPSDADGQARTLVGATPELLLEKSGDLVVSHPLAGSTPRRPSPADDRAAAEALLRSEKDQREHAAVVEAIADVLTPYCIALDIPRSPSLVSTATMWHLGTRITGRLRCDGTSSLELLDVVHPTPAVCGVPQDRARALIAELEAFDRDYFTGAVGWCDARGDGRWLVTIRCAEISGTRARLYAGAGIVVGSDPVNEGAETSAKLETMLRALNVQEVVSRAGMLAGSA